MKNIKRILALAAVVLLAGMYVCTMIFAFMDNRAAQTLFRASLACTVILPVLLYAFLLIARVLRPSKSPVVDSIIFDMGGVLLNAPWEEAAKQMHFSAEDAALIGSIVTSKVWPELDRNVLPRDEVIKQLAAMAPGHEEQVSYFVDHIPEWITPFPYSASWLTELKTKGYKLYLLSNMPEDFYDQMKAGGALDFEDIFDGTIWSYRVRQIKPNRDIFETLISTFSLTPERSVFLDDNAANTAAAREIGINTITFTGYEDAREKLAALGVK
ncbi:MAG: HAD-IA family hydrolase [Lachnospiraceae bacterium]|nr:HAD-IA family hydrolase [Lachnospiraceae bacterium]